MKKLLFFGLLSVAVVVFLPHSFGQEGGAAHEVRLIYFVPRHLEPQRNIDASLHTLITQVQKLFADEMQRHGFGQKTFGFETNAGKAVVHRVNGAFEETYYQTQTVDKVIDELHGRYDTSKHAYVVVIEMVNPKFDDGSSCGKARYTDQGRGGFIFIPAGGVCLAEGRDVSLVAHELGHIFGLRHDFRDDVYIMSYGALKNELSVCAAEWLDVHPFLNPPRKALNAPSEIQMLGVEEVSPKGLRFRFQVGDPDGLHQAQLLVKTHFSVAALGDLEMLACHRLTGKSRIVEFQTTALMTRPAKTISLQVMDVSGNYTLKTFPIQRAVVPGPKIEGPWLWMVVPTPRPGGASAAASGIDFLAEASHGSLTEQQVANQGARLGEAVGNQVWTPGRLAATGKDNLTQMIQTIGLGFGDIDHHVAYGCVVLRSLHQQETTLYVGSDDAVKVWLNGTLVHSNPINRENLDYQDSVPVVLEPGENILLVAVYENWGDWSAFFGFENTTAYTVVDIEGDPVLPPTKIAGPKIEGPWLWVIVPTPRPGGASAAASGIDFLAEASRGSLTEQQVANQGARLGEVVGNQVWTAAKLSAVNSNNINDMLNATGLGRGDIDHHVAYGCVVLESPHPQETTLYVGSDDAVKVWLNGTLVHSNPIDRGASDYEDILPVTLKKGKNVLLIAVYENREGWSGFFGLEKRAVYTLLPPETQNLVVDVNQDGKVNATDLRLVVDALGKKATTNPRTDVNGDGTTDVADLLDVIENLDDPKAAAAPSRGGPPTPLKTASLVAALHRLRTQSDGSVKYQHAIAYLENLLTVSDPDQTRVLANYPNPSNPETWIPYHLATAAAVRIVIYDVQGRVVRHLDLGHQSAGRYESRSRAAFWDGRNEVGEPVASGVYFYTLTAGEFTATRKLLMRK